MSHPAAPVTDSLSKPVAKERRAPCPSRSGPRIPAAAATLAPATALQHYRNRSKEPAPPRPGVEAGSFARRDSFHLSKIQAAALSPQSCVPLELLSRRAPSVLLVLARAPPLRAIARRYSNSDLSR